MKTFTINSDNNITAFGTQEEAAATTTTPFDSFASQQDLAELAAGWPPERLVAVWNSLPGVKPVKSFKTAKVAAGRIWESIQSLGETAKPKANASDRCPAAEPPIRGTRSFMGRESLGNPELRDEGGYLIEPFDVWQSQFAGLQLVVLTQFIFELPDHALVAPTDCGRTLVRFALAHLGKCLLKALNLGHCSFSLRVALDHDLSAFTT